MKIGLICPYNMFRGGGVQECVLAMQLELQKRGHEASIITPLPRDQMPANVPQNVIFLGAGANVKSPFHTTPQISVSVNADLVDDLLAHHKFDILHFHEPWVPILSRQILSRSTSINVATFHAKLPETVMSRTIERVITPYTRSVLKYFNGFTACSPAAAEYVTTLTNQPVNIIQNGIDLERYKHGKPSAKRQSSILYIGRLEKRKGLKFLLQAWQQVAVRNPEARLIIAGDGVDRVKLEDLARDLKLPRVEFLGYIDDATKRRLMAESRLFCSPALYGESFGIVLLEAMASGMPTIAGDNPGYRSVLQERGALSLVDPRNVDEFARRISLFLEDDELCELWRAWAATYVQQFSYHKVVDMYEQFYKDLLAVKTR